MRGMEGMGLIIFQKFVGPLLRALTLNYVYLTGAQQEEGALFYNVQIQAYIHPSRVDQQKATNEASTSPFTVH